MCSLLQICVQYSIDVAYVVEIKLNSIQFNSSSHIVTKGVNMLFEEPWNISINQTNINETS